MNPLALERRQAQYRQIREALARIAELYRLLGQDELAEHYRGESRAITAALVRTAVASSRGGGAGEVRL